jgi:tRNA pseudouridine55 synthase
MDGIIVVDKPKGWTSFDVVARVRSLTKIKRVGHAGTLDPMATGVLVILLGACTKLSDKFLVGNKGYEAELTFGITTDTLDAEGNVLSKHPLTAQISEKRLLDVLSKFTGPIKQIPPMTSAKKRNGVRLYKLARKGIEIEREPVAVTIHELSLKKMTDGDFPKAEVYCRCSKGTYIRALADDIGRELGVGAHLSALRRTLSFPFSISQSHTMDEVEKLIKAGQIDKIVTSPNEVNA